MLCTVFWAAAAGLAFGFSAAGVLEAAGFSAAGVAGAAGAAGFADGAGAGFVSVFYSWTTDKTARLFNLKNILEWGLSFIVSSSLRQKLGLL